MRRFLLFILLIIVTNSPNAQTDQEMCSFGGSVPDPEYWDKYEFDSLVLADDSMPDYLIFQMIKVIGNIAITDKNILKSPSCIVSQYVLALLRFYDQHQAKIRQHHTNLADLLEFIKTKLDDGQPISVIDVPEPIYPPPQQNNNEKHLKKSPIEEFREQTCKFDGIFHDEARWPEEFQMLEEPEDHPNYQTITSHLGNFMIMPDNQFRKCPTLVKYLTQLINYHANSTKVSTDQKMIFEFLTKHKLANTNNRWQNLYDWLYRWLSETVPFKKHEEL